MSLSRRFSSHFSTLGSTFVLPYGDKIRESVSFPAAGRTKQYFRDECDVNRIMARYLETGILDGRDPASARFVDCTALQALDYQGAMNFIIDAQAVFSSLPSSIRSRFRNDPAELLAFVDNPANRDEAISLGLVPNPAAQAASVPLGTSNPEGGSVAAQV